MSLVCQSALLSPGCWAPAARRRGSALREAQRKERWLQQQPQEGGGRRRVGEGGRRRRRHEGGSGSYPLRGGAAQCSAAGDALAGALEALRENLASGSWSLTPIQAALAAAAALTAYASGSVSGRKEVKEQIAASEKRAARRRVQSAVGQVRPDIGAAAQQRRGSPSRLIGAAATRPRKRVVATAAQAWESVAAKLQRVEGAEANSLPPLLSSFEEDETSEPAIPAAPKLSLQGLSEWPRQRLLATSYERVRAAVTALDTSQADTAWIDVVTDLFTKCAIDTTETWLEYEFADVVPVEGDVSSAAGTADAIQTEPPTSSPQNTSLALLRQSVTALQSLSAAEPLLQSDRAVLYADLLYFLKFDKARPGGQLTTSSLLFASAVLEDLVIYVANNAAAAYLGQLALGVLGDSVELPTLAHPSLTSTRAIERFRNQVALRNWVQDNFTSVVAICEDRHELWTLQVGTPTDITEEPPTTLQLIQRYLPVRRIEELQAFTGWKLLVSISLEAADILWPLARSLFAKASNAASFLLVSLIGRSLGLIFKGIRQSLRRDSRVTD
eukprot:jgi/Chlat1/8742/Chrsp9S08568